MHGGANARSDALADDLVGSDALTDACSDDLAAPDALADARSDDLAAPDALADACSDDLARSDALTDACSDDFAAPDALADARSDDHAVAVGRSDHAVAVGRADEFASAINGRAHHLCSAHAHPVGFAVALCGYLGALCDRLCLFSLSRLVPVFALGEPVLSRQPPGPRRVACCDPGQRDESVAPARFLVPRLLS